MTTQGQRLSWLARAELRRAEGRSDEALDIIDRLYASTKNLSEEGDLPILALFKAELVLQGDQPEQSLPLVDAAIRTAAADGGRTTEARLRILRVMVLDALGRHDEALRERDHAVRMIHGMAETLPEEARATYLASALGSLPSGYRDERGTGRDGGLTRREAEVAGLVASGLTNRQISDQLFIAERTVESHVSAILRKLGFSARTQIAAWQVQRDLRET